MGQSSKEREREREKGGEHGRTDRCGHCCGLQIEIANAGLLAECYQFFPSLSIHLPLSALVSFIAFFCTKLWLLAFVINGARIMYASVCGLKGSGKHIKQMKPLNKHGQVYIILHHSLAR